MIYKSQSEKDTNNLAKEIIDDYLNGYRIVCLYGNLGTGKTTFVKEFAKLLGVKARIISPTFVLVRKHKTLNGRNFYHIDAYRISDLERRDSEAINEILEEKNAIIIIEWAERIKNILPKKRIDITFNYLEKRDEREITIIKR